MSNCFKRLRRPLIALFLKLHVLFFLFDKRFALDNWRFNSNRLAVQLTSKTRNLPSMDWHFWICWVFNDGGNYWAV